MNAIMQVARLLWVIPILFVLQMATPLRLEPDSVSYLRMAQSAAQGSGFQVPDQLSYFPPGYPAMVVLLIWTGLASPMGLVALNLICLAAAAVAAWKLYQSVFGWTSRFAGVLTALGMLSWIVVKHSAMPLSECLFCALSLWAVLLMDRAIRCAKSPRASGWLAMAALLCGASLTVRTIGVALLPALAWTTWIVLRRSTPSAGIWRWMPAVVLVIAIIASAIGLRSSAFSTYSQQQGNQSVSVADRLSYRLLEAGEVVVNTSASKLPFVPPMAVRVVGAALFGVLVFAAYKRFLDLHPLDVFTGAYVVVLFTWPFYDPRFWMPVIVPLAAYIALALEGLPRLRTLYVLGVSTTGLVALGYSISLAFAGSEFPDRFGGGSRRAEYCIGLYGCPPGDAPVDAALVEVLRTFR